MHNLAKNISINTHASIKIQSQNLNIYFDPYEIPEKNHDADIVFITHNHYDHLQPESILKIANDTTTFVMPKTILEDFAEKLPTIKGDTIGLEVNEKINLQDTNILAVPAYNTNKDFHPKEKSWLGYVIETNNIKYYIAGDTDALEVNTNINCDVALIPVGGKYTMNAKEAAKFIKQLAPKLAIPTHYGNIVGTKEDGETFRNLLSDTDIAAEVIL